MKPRATRLSNFRFRKRLALLLAAILSSLLLLAQGLSGVRFLPGSLQLQWHPSGLERPHRAEGELPRDTIDWLSPLWLGWNPVAAVTFLVFAILAIFSPHCARNSSQRC